MKFRENSILALVASCAGAAVMAAETPLLMEKHNNARAKTVIESGTPLRPTQTFVGPTGPVGERGFKGATGETGSVGPDGVFKPSYATVYLSADTPASQRRIEPAGMYTVPFTHIGLHSDQVSFHPACHRLSLPPGLYSIAVQFVLWPPEGHDDYPGYGPPDNSPDIPKVFACLHPQSGTPIFSTVDVVRGNANDRGFVYSFMYLGKTLLRVPDGMRHELSLMFCKSDTVRFEFYDPDIPTSYEEGYNNPARMTVVRIAES